MTALSPRLQPLFEKTKTVCFGHFVVEVPATATAVRGGEDVDSPITYFPGESEKLEQHVAAQLVEVEKDRDYLRKGSEFVEADSLFGKVIDGILPGQKLVFGSKDHVFYSIDSFVPVGKDLFVQHSAAALSKDDEIKSLNSVASHLRLRSEDEVPTEAGTCIDGGFVSWQPEFARASMGVRLKEFPDVHFSIQVIKNLQYIIESSALEPRLKRAEAIGGTWYSRVKFFRRGPRQLGDWKGFEALARKPAQEDKTESHEFAFVSLGAPNDPLQPQFDIKLDTGVKDDETASVKPSLTDEEAVALWDKLIGSIRVRPTGDAVKHSTATPPRTPLGAYIDSGSECPQSGLWRCSDIGEVAGGRRRHFVAGDTMPPAILLGKPDMWQRMKNQRPRHEIPTVWELLECEVVITGEASQSDAEPPKEA
jgi:hypothetical protein